MGKRTILFVDIEWNQMAEGMNPEQDEITQIAGISLSDDYAEERRFFKLVRPQHIGDISPTIMKMQKLNMGALQDAKDFENVMDRFFQTFLQIDVIVMWNNDAYEMFRYNIKRVGFAMPKHEVVILQDLIAYVPQSDLRKIGFCKALAMAGIDYRGELLHIAKHDVDYLQQLYKKVYKPVCYVEEKVLAQESVVGKKRIVCGRNVTAKSKRTRRLLSEDYIHLICKEFGVQCRVGEGVIFIKTNASSWRVFHDGEQVTDLYHENYKMTKVQYCGTGKGNWGYHRQDINKKSLRAVVDYIVGHDRNFLNKRLKSKSKVERLLETINR